MNIVHATMKDYSYIIERDHHVHESLVARKIRDNEIYMIRDWDNGNIGWMRFGYFWDNTPFMNMIWIDVQFRNSGMGRKAVERWEEEMKGKGFTHVMTSTLANESAQHFYRKMGYRDAGCLLLEDEPLEILFHKKL